MAYLSSAILAVLALMPIVAHPGIPAYQHDWSWPPDSRSVLAGIIGHVSAWDPQGLGFPNALASANPINLILPLPAIFFDSGIALRIALIAAFAAGAVGTTLASARIMDAPPWAACAAALVYSTSPVLLDNLGAGHIGFWYAYAMLPFAVWLGFESVRTGPRLSYLFGICLLGSLITIQPQFAAFGLGATIAGAIMANPRWLPIPASAFLIGALISLMPVFVALNSAQHYLDWLYPRPQIGWERLLSTPWPDVIWITNYVVPYYARSNAAGVPYLEVFSVIALLAIAAVRPLRHLLALAFLALLGIFLATGVLGPAHSLWWSLYAHIYPATAFRDASSGESLIALAYALILAASWRRTYVAAPLVVLVTAAFAPLLLGGAASIARNVLLPRDVAIRAEVATLPRGRIASTPLAAPVIYDATPGGVDVDAIADSNHPSLAEYPTLPPLTTIAAAGRFDRPWVGDALSRMGVVALVERPGFWSGDLVRQGEQQHVAHVAGVRMIRSDGMVAFARASTDEPLTYKNALPVDTTGLDSPDGPLPPQGANEAAFVLEFQRLTLGDDPTSGWALLTRWYALDRSEPTIGQGTVTESSVPLSVPLSRGKWWLLHSGGRLNVVSGAAHSVLLASPTPRWDAVRSDRQIVLRSIDREAVVYRLARGREGNIPVRRFSPATWSYALRSPWRTDVQARSKAKGPWLLVFRTRYSPGWHVEGTTAVWHGVADGYANAFLLTALPRQFSIYYEPQKAFIAACAFVWLIQLTLVALCIKFRSRRFAFVTSPSHVA
jgi:hypothetical protein